jgi:hypothetical protein
MPATQAAIIAPAINYHGTRPGLPANFGSAHIGHALQVAEATVTRSDDDSSLHRDRPSGFLQLEVLLLLRVSYRIGRPQAADSLPSFCKQQYQPECQVYDYAGIGWI